MVLKGSQGLDWIRGHVVRESFFLVDSAIFFLNQSLPGFRNHLSETIEV